MGSSQVIDPQAQRERYLLTLDRLPILNPTKEDMASLCPYLMPEEAEKAFLNGIRVVGPPLLVRDSFHVFVYKQEETGFKNNQASLDLLGTYRTLAFRANGKPSDERSLIFEHICLAMVFAKQHWDEKLVTDNSACVGQFYIYHPTDVTKDCVHDGPINIKVILGVALSRDLKEIFEDSSKPQSELLDEAILRMTLHYLEWYELVGGRRSFKRSNCACCGSGLWRFLCTGCKHKHLGNLDGEWSTPLPSKVIAFLLDQGYEFELDPKLAQNKEREEWKCRQYEYKKLLQRW